MPQYEPDTVQRIFEIPHFAKCHFLKEQRKIFVLNLCCRPLDQLNLGNMRHTKIASGQFALSNPH